MPQHPYYFLLPFYYLSVYIYLLCRQCSLRREYNRGWVTQLRWGTRSRWWEVRRRSRRSHRRRSDRRQGGGLSWWSDRCGWLPKSVGRSLVERRGSVHRLGLDARHDGISLVGAHFFPQEPVRFLRVLVAVEGDVAHGVNCHLAVDKFRTVWIREESLEKKTLKKNEFST